MDVDQQKFLFTVPETCRAIGSGRTKVYELIALGQLDARSSGGRTVITGDSIRSYARDLPPAPIRRRETATSINNTIKQTTAGRT